MGAHPYWYFYETKAGAEFALQLLRKREFEAGRYYPVIDDLEFPLNEKSPSPGPRHENIDEVFEGMDETGTRSILDIAKISEDEGELCSAYMINGDELDELFGNAKPTRKIIEDNLDCFEHLDRGICRFCMYYNDKGDFIGYFFIGYSLD